MTIWMHERKGRIEGVIIADHGEFVDIRLTVDQRLGLASRYSDPNFEEGEIIGARKSMLREIEPSLDRHNHDHSLIGDFNGCARCFEDSQRALNRTVPVSAGEAEKE